jgi:hypothetical protein
MKIYICGNSEIVCDGRIPNRQESYEDEFCQEFVDGAVEVLRNSAILEEDDWEISRNFRDWNGGKLYGLGSKYKPGYSLGLIAVIWDFEEVVASEFAIELQNIIETALESGLIRMVDYSELLDKTI